MELKQISSNSNSTICCHVCGNSVVDIVPNYDMFYRVTSDCKSWKRGGHLVMCKSCGTVQKVIDSFWLSEIDEIYESYSIYHQGNGTEQCVFTQKSNQGSSRSSFLLKQLSANIQLPKIGRLLDIGCGNGAFLGSFSQYKTFWSMVGTELNNKYKKSVESIKGVEGLHTCKPNQVPGTFNIITMIHVLEHIPHPIIFLNKLRDKLEFGGLLVIDVPDYLQNPFDLLIADHCTHFSVDTVTNLIRKAGYEVIIVATDWIPKELIIIAKKNENIEKTPRKKLITTSFNSVVSSIQWLQSLSMSARQLSKSDCFGIFGTSIAATWLFSELEGSVNFFVDEDINRTGTIYMGCPVYHPQQVPDGSQVFIALPNRIAEDVKTRMELSKYDFDCHVPPIKTENKF